MKGFSFVLVLSVSHWLITETTALPSQTASIDEQKSEKTVAVDEVKETNAPKAQDGQRYKCIVQNVYSDNQPEYEGPRIGNKCYMVSDQVFIKPATYENAEKECQRFGGELAQPSLLEGSTFGADLASEYGYLDQQRYWISGEGYSNPSRITSGDGYIIPENSSRYQSVSGLRKANPTVDVNSRLTLVGPLKENEIKEWFVDVADGSSPDSVYPFICEFTTVLV